MPGRSNAHSATPEGASVLNWNRRPVEEAISRSACISFDWICPLARHFIGQRRFERKWRYEGDE
jgi:hypothetical protein